MRDRAYPHCTKALPGRFARSSLASAMLATGLVSTAVGQGITPDAPSGSGMIAPSGVPSQIVGGPIAAEAPRRGAQGWATDASVTAQATLTNNANYGAADDRQGDLIFNLLPAISFSREGARLRVAGSASLNMIGYVDGVQTSRILPQVSVLANLEAIERLFFIDASIVANQEVINPFLPQPEFTSTVNQYTYWQGRLAPYLQGNFGQNFNWLIRSDNSFTYTTQTDAPLGNAYYGNQTAELVRRPTPLGYSMKLQKQLTRIQGQVQQDQRLNTALGTLDYQFTPQFSFGLRGGYENTNYTASETAGPIYGATLAWLPSPLTRVAGYWEQRFFGPSYVFDASNRQRMLASSLSASRQIATYPQLLLQIPATSNVSSLLNAILLGRFPDPIERAQQVQELINRQSLPQSLPAGTNIYSQNANVLTSATANFALIGVRNTLAFNLYYLKTETLPDSKIPPTFVLINNNVQEGAGVTLSHKLTPQIVLNGSLSGLQTRGFDSSDGLNSKQGIAQLQANFQLSNSNSLFVGARYQFQTSSTIGFGDTSEAAIFTGLFHSL